MIKKKKLKDKKVKRNLNEVHKELPIPKIIEEEKPKVKISNKLPDNIDEYFAKIEGSKEAFHSRELLRGDKDVDLKTDLTAEEISYINTLLYNDALLKSRGLKPVYSSFLNNLMRLKFSLDRKSRSEFVTINKSDKTDEALGIASSISNITGVKK